jgi:hypothetical protein
MIINISENIAEEREDGVGSNFFLIVLQAGDVGELELDV